MTHDTDDAIDTSGLPFDVDRAYENFRATVSKNAFKYAIRIMDGLCKADEEGKPFDLTTVRPADEIYAFEQAIMELVVVGYMERQADGSVRFDNAMLYADDTTDDEKKEMRRASKEARRVFAELHKRGTKPLH